MKEGDFMGLINCPECNNQVSNMANVCPRCGFPLRQQQNFTQNQNVRMNPQQPNRSTGQPAPLCSMGSSDPRIQQRNRRFSRNTLTKTCKHCQAVIDKKATVCPVCRKSVGTNTRALITFLVFALFTYVIVSNFLRITSVPITTETFTQIEDVKKYSLISVEELKNLFGEPNDEGTWTNLTSHGDVELTTLEYDINSNHYEFVIGDGLVVRLSIYSNQYWNRQGELFSYSSDNKDEILEMFGVTPDGTANLVCDNSFTYRYTPANDLIKDFNVQEIDSANKTFGFIKVTYDQTYFN